MAIVCRQISSAFVKVWKTNALGTWAHDVIADRSQVVVLESDGSMTKVLYATGIGWVYSECVKEEETSDE